MYQSGGTMKTLAIIALTATVTLFGATEEHGNQGATREATPATVQVV